MKSFYGNRRSVRLIGYDYSQKGMYFLTICAKERQTWFGKIIGGIMEINDLGKKVLSIWNELPQRFAVKTDVSQIMPNHFHAILFVKELFQVPKPIAAHRSAQLRRQPRSLGAIVAGFKSAASRAARQSLWQRNYYDRIIRDEEELNRIRNYIIYNPIMLSESRKEIWKHAK